LDEKTSVNLGSEFKKMSAEKRKETGLWIRSSAGILWR